MKVLLIHLISLAVLLLKMVPKSLNFLSEFPANHPHNTSYMTFAQAVLLFLSMIVFIILSHTIKAACAKSGALWQGKWIHEYIKKKSLECDVFVRTALVEMYAKCGCINMAIQVFEEMAKRNSFSWAAMFGGFAIHGYARKAISSFERMQAEDGLRLDWVVLLTALTACGHAGLQEEGWFLLDNMKARYGIVQRHEHYSCVVDLLCRAGRWNDAIALIKRMLMKPLASVWGAVLSSYRTHKNVELAELAVNELPQLEDGNGHKEDAAFVQLENIYLNSGRGEDAYKIHRMIGERGLKKTLGCSKRQLEKTLIFKLNGELEKTASGENGKLLVEGLLCQQNIDFPVKWPQK